MIAETSIRQPRGEPPNGGWPVLVFLHGCGGTGSEHTPHAIAATALGLAAVAIPGPIVAPGGGLAWPADGFETTHAYLQRELTRCVGQFRLDRSRPLLCGFSQGATHVVGLLATNPDAYAGGIALSPGEGPPIPAPDRLRSVRPPLYVAYGAREFPAFRKMARRCADVWRRAGYPTRLETHAGSHHMPLDWETRLPQIMRWLGAQVFDATNRAEMQPAKEQPAPQPRTEGESR
jgi:predicted esterase